jgi:hypothetical protein
MLQMYKVTVINSNNSGGDSDDDNMLIPTQCI